MASAPPPHASMTLAALGKALLCCVLVLQLAADSNGSTSSAGGEGALGDSRASVKDYPSSLRRILQVFEENIVEDDSFPLLRDEATDRQARELAIASSTGQNQAILELLEAGVDPDLLTSVGTPALWRAAFNDHLTTVKLLLDAGASIDATNSNGTTALYAAAQNGNLEIVETLISRGADLDLQAKWGSSPLLVASQQGFASIVEDLLEAGAAVSVKKVKSGQGAVWSAAFSGYNDVVKLLIQKSAAVDSPDASGTTPLFAASQNNHTDVVKTLLRAGANPNQVRPDKNSPLHTAAFHCHSSVVTLLIEKNANKSLVNNMGNKAVELTCLYNGHRLPLHEGIMGLEERLIVDQLAPLFASARSRDTFLTSQLIDNGENVDDKLPNAWTPLHEAALSGSAGVTNTLLAAGAEANSVDRTNKTAAHISARNGAVEVLEVLAQYGADLNSKDVYGQTPLQLAASADQTPAISELLIDGVPIDEIDYRGQTALHLAAKSVSVEAVGLLLDQGADQSIKDMDGLMPVQVIGQSNGSRATAEKTIEDLFFKQMAPLLVDAPRNDNSALVRQWLEIGIDVKFLFFDGTSALHAAAAVGDFGLVRELLDYGLDINLQDNNNHTILHVAAELGKNNIIGLLFSRSANSHVTDVDGRTALHLAAASAQANPETVQLLLGFRGDVNSRDSSGRTPLHLAVKNDKLDAARELIQSGADVSVRDHFGKLPSDLVPTYLGSTRRQEFADLLEMGEKKEVAETNSITSPPTNAERSAEVSQLSPGKGPSHEHYGSTAKSGISEMLLFFVVFFPGLFLCALCGVATYIFKRSREGGIPSRWEKSNILDTPSTIWTELYVPSEGSVRSSSLPLRSRQGHLSRATSDPSEQDVMSPGIFRNPYYAEGPSQPTVNPICELEDAADTPAQLRPRPVPFGSTEIWTAPSATHPSNTSSPISSSVPQRSCISFSEKGTSPRSESPLESELKSKSERLISGRPNTVPLPLHNMRVDIQRVRRRERNLTLYADAQSHFSSQSSKSFQSESAYFSAASVIGSHHLSQESFGSNHGEVYTLQGLQIPEDQELGGGMRSSGNLEMGASKFAKMLQDTTSKP